MLRPTGSDVIASLATAPGAAALAVVRLSGPDVFAVADRVFCGNRPLAQIAGYQGAHGWIRAEDRPVDEVVAWVYRAPHSYSGEDMVEFSCHGGSVSGRRVLETTWTAGARPAEPGEFTRRAFLNGRIDLTQAEAVADLIASQTRASRRAALEQLRGSLTQRLQPIRQDLLETLADIEDLDYAAALSRLSLEVTTLEAAQQSFVRTQSLSLFNYF